MHFVISVTWGPTDPTRAMLPFIFAASAVQAGDEVTLMLFHDALYMAVEGAGGKPVPGGAPQRHEDVARHPQTTPWGSQTLVQGPRPFRAELRRRTQLGGAKH